VDGAPKRQAKEAGWRDTACVLDAGSDAQHKTKENVRQSNLHPRWHWTPTLFLEITSTPGFLLLCPAKLSD
jgi:hypothetical protein